MKELIRKYWILSLLFLCTISLNAQTNKASIYVNARAQQDKILIRWAVDNPVAWQKTNKDGFVIYKLLIKKDGKLVDNPSKKMLTIIKADPLEEWMDFIQKDNYGAIVAQALYGESFEVGQESPDQLSQIVNMSDELNQRYAFALYAADLSFEAAKRAGWGYEDTNVIKGETYAYQIEAFQNADINSGAYLIGLADFESLPKITDLIAIPDDKQVMLSWGIEHLKRTYGSYLIERSTDGKNFTAISETPIVDINSNSEKNSKQMFFGAKLEFNDQNYFFRIYGINAFGEKGPVSDAIKTKGVTSVMVAPRIINYAIVNPGEVEIEWEFPLAEQKNIQSFELLYAEKDLTEYQVVVKDIDKNKRKQRYKNLASSNYFKVSAVGLQGKKLTSQSTFIQPIDSIPPVKPTGLEGKIDSLGYVTLKWKPNTERDLAGYRVLRANTETEEFVDLFNRIIYEPNALDTVSLTISNKKVYYRIIAEDMRYNRSEFSDVLVLVKPDTNAPTAPIFKDYDTKDGANILVWISSTSDDVDKHYLKRRIKGEKQWLVIGTFTNEDGQFIDDKTEANKTYEYLIQAKDKSGLFSPEEASIVTITTLDNRPIVVMKNIETMVDREKKTASIVWNYDKNYSVAELQIYKSVKGQKPSLWKVIDGKFNSITDKDLKMNTEYEYYFVPELNDEKIAKGEKVILNY